MGKVRAIQLYLLGSELLNVGNLFTGRIAGYKLDIVWNHPDKVIDNRFGGSLTLVIGGILHTLLSSSVGREYLDGWESWIKGTRQKTTALEKRGRPARGVNTKQHESYTFDIILRADGSVLIIVTVDCCQFDDAIQVLCSSLVVWCQTKKLRGEVSAVVLLTRCRARRHQVLW